MSTGFKLGFRQTQAIQLMARSGNRWPVGWKLRGSERATVASLVRRGWVESLDNPVFTDAGRNFAFWLTTTDYESTSADR